MQLNKLLQIRDPLMWTELVPWYVTLQEVIKALDPSLDYVELIYP